MILTIPHLKRGEIMSPRSKETVRIIKGELLSIEVVVDNIYEDKLFFVGVMEPGKWYVKVKMVISCSKEYREDIETACVYSSTHYENATYVGKRLLEKFHRAMDEETKIDMAGMVKGILIENNMAAPEPEATDEDEDDDDGDDGEDGGGEKAKKAKTQLRSGPGTTFPQRVIALVMALVMVMVMVRI